MRRTALAVMLLAVAAVALEAAPAQGGRDIRHFQVNVKATGELFVDYFEDRREPGLTTAIGVDGTEARTWSWEVRAVGKSVDGGPIESTRAAVRARTLFQSTIVDHTVLMGVLKETPLGCRGGTWTSWDGKGSGPPAEGDFVRLNRPLAIGAELDVFVPAMHRSSVLCGYHGSFLDVGVETLFPAYGSQGDAPALPRRASNPRPDRPFTATWRYAPPAVPADHGVVVDPNQLHTVSTSSKLTLSVKRISEETWRRLNDDLARAPKGRWSVAPPRR